jgi:small subunit ribosomal protein S17e
MGRIKTQLVKRTTFELLKRSKDKFTDNYEKNKEVVNKLIDVKSKKIKNTIAGYATRIIKRGYEKPAPKKDAEEHKDNS